MDEIFLSYRRDDAGYVAANVADSLQQRFGAGSVFLDTGSLAPGVPFPPEIDGALRRCLVLVVLIGPGWLAATTPAGHRRIDDPDDWVRRELVTALRSGVAIVPVLLDGATLPRSSELPPELRGFLLYGLARISAERLPADIAGLVENIRRLVPRLQEVAAATPRPGGPVQQNRVDGGGDLFANQGGGMTVNVDRSRRARR